MSVHASNTGSVSNGSVVGHAEQRPGRRWVYGGAAAGLAIVVAAISLLAWRPWNNEPPRLNEDPHRIAKFVISEDFKRLPFERQFTFMELLDDKEDALVQACADRRLTDDEYARALQAAYLGKHMKRARNYAEKTTPRLKEAYLDKLIDKKKKNKEEDEKVKSRSKTAAAEPSEIKRDDTGEQETINAWPPEAVAQWNTYRAALRQRKDYLDEQEAKRSPAAAATPAEK